jgi:hypothetical protein
MSARDEVVRWAKWGVANAHRFTYSEGPKRMSAVHKKGELPIISDCSAFVTICYSWAGAPDPNGSNYNGYGYTGTLLTHGEKIPLSEVQPGDVIVYGPGTGWHTAIVVSAGPDPITVSMGRQGDPSYVRVSQDGRLPQTYLRFLPKDSSKVAPVNTPTKTLQPQIALGDKGAVVYKLQQLLVLKGRNKTLKIDGEFGPLTENAVRDFQKTHGLGVDGVCGPATWKALGA